MSAVDIFRQVELFRGLDDSGLDRIATIARAEIYAPGQTIFEQGSPADSLYVIHSGQVEIAVRTASGDIYPAVYLGSGQVVGEMGLIDAGKRSASAIAVEDSTLVYCIYGAEFTQLCEQDTAIGYVIMRNIAQDLSFKLRHQDSGQ
jgi:CRP-like cAMP-binding protein